MNKYKILISITLLCLPIFANAQEEIFDNDTLGNSAIKEYLNQIVITGTRTQRALKDVPVVTRLITADEIKKQAPVSISDLLQLELPGLEFTRTEGVSNSITFQGMSANYLLILVDGERMAGETQRSNPDFNRIDIDNVERIEIVKGAMSALYGSGAVAGIINIITKNATKPFQANINGMYDGEGLERVGASVGFKKNKLASYTSAVANFRQRYFFENTEIEGFRNYSVTEKLSYTIPDKLKLNARASFYNHQRYNASLVGKVMNDLYRDYNILLSGQWLVNEKNTVDFSYNYDNYSKYAKYLNIKETERNYRDIINNPKVIFTTQAIKKNVLMAAVELIDESLDTYQFNGKAKSAWQGSAFVQSDYRFNNRFSLQAGLRADYHSSYNGVHLTPKLSLMYKFGSVNSWSIRAGYSSGFRTPTLKELFTSWDHQGMFVLMGNPSLKPEKSKNFQTALEFSNSKINIGASGFYNYIYDKISTVWNTAQDTSYYANIDKAKVYGADAFVRVQLLKNFAFKAGYAYVCDKQLVDGYNLSASRPHSATVRFEYNCQVLKCPLTFGLNGRWLSKVDTWSQETEGVYKPIHYAAYQIWKINMVAKIPYGIKVNMGINNLFNYKPNVVTYNAGITKGITFFAGLSLDLEDLF